MLFLREILLLAMVLCVCWETGDTTCQTECDKSQIGLPLPTCFLRDNGTETRCLKFIDGSDPAIQTLGSFDELTLILDLPTQVNILDLYNFIDNKVKVDTYRFHSEITQLFLYGNTQINPGMFFFFQNLTYLRMESVFFEYFPYFAYENRKLTYLLLSDFDIPSTFPPILTKEHVSGLTGLQYLYISPTQYMNTTDQSFTGLTSLTYLYLEQFHIPNPIPTLSPLVRLREFWLNRCELTDISFLTKTPLFELNLLYLFHDLITQIQPGIFSNYTNLVGLHLYSNKLVQLESGAFTGLTSLAYLNLHYNPIQQISFNAFKGLEYLTELTLSNTPLTSLSSRMFEYLSKLSSIWLSSTPLHCDCELQWMSIVEHSFGLYFFNAVCASPPEHRYKQATDLSIYTNCTPDLSYQCFNRSNSCPNGTYCQDTLYSYICVSEQEGYQFVNQEISNDLPQLSETTPTCPSCPTKATYPVVRPQPCKCPPTLNLL